MNIFLARQQRIWRWHFWAGLMSLPLAIVLALSGAIYLFKPQYQAWFERSLEPPFSAVVLQKRQLKAKPPEQLLLALKSQYPEASFKRYTLAKHPRTDRSIEIEMLHQGQLWLFYMDRFNGQLLHAGPKGQSLMSWIKKLHGELQLGNQGSYIVEFMAQWMIVLIISGLYLSLSRQLRAAKGRWGLALKRSLWPNLPGANGRLFWRRLHAMLGFWFGLLILVFLLSGLPWTQVWGSGFKKVQSYMGWSQTGQSMRGAAKSAPAEHHHEDLWSLRSEQENQPALASSGLWQGGNGFGLNTLVGLAQQQNLAAPVIIQPPKNAQGVWVLKSMSQDRSQRVVIHYDRLNGEQIKRVDFSDHHPVKRLVSHGISLHEGALFGWPNQVLGVLAALAVIMLACSAGIMWWRRRPQGKWGAPETVLVQLSGGMIVAVLVLAALLPLFAASLLLVLVLDPLILSFKRWQA